MPCHCCRLPASGLVLSCLVLFLKLGIHIIVAIGDGSWGAAAAAAGGGLDLHLNKGGDPSRGGRARSGDKDHVRGPPGPGVPGGERHEGAGRQEGRLRDALHAHGSRGGRRYARLRSPGGPAQRGLRRLQRRGFARPHRGECFECLFIERTRPTTTRQLLLPCALVKCNCIYPRKRRSAIAQTQRARVNPVLVWW